jgi:predicted  nucleic acid-binding Zn-ribbon protein
LILETVIALIEKRDALNAQQQAVQAQLQAVRENQQRIRDNLKSVPVKSEPHSRYMNELNKVDAQDSALQTELSDIRLKQQVQEKLLQEYFARLK